MPTLAALRNCQYLKLVLSRLTLAAIQTSTSFLYFLTPIYIAILVLTTDSGIKVCMMPLVTQVFRSKETLKFR